MRDDNGRMSRLGAAELAFWLLLAVCVYAGSQLRRGGLDVQMRLGLAANLVGIGFVWLRANKPLEGPTLLVVSTGHGLTLGDVLVLVPAALTTVLVRRQVSLVLARLNRR